jgi:N-acetylglucosaminyldiphosphoundecaprenol N-acetyl-beta-D-mannosaminyltransferase
MEDQEVDRGSAPARVVLMGLAIDRVGEADVIAHVMDELDRGRGGSISTPNLHHLREFRARPELRSLFAQASLVVADGMPLVWASRLQRTPLPERVAGSELIWSLSAEAALNGRSVYLLGDRPAAREMAEHKLRSNYPGLRIAGSYSPPLGFEHDPGELARIRAEMVEARPDIVYVALGFPKQEQLIAQLRPALPGTWFMGVGASLSFLGGYVERAPERLATAGLEWAHRLATDPRRLARRYLLHGLPFAARLLVGARARGLLRRAAGPPPRGAASERKLVFPSGSLERARAADLAALSDAHRDVLPVSVVIPAYRRPEMIERALRSVLAQRRLPAEIIVVDDASGDDTGGRAQALGATVLTHADNRGRGAARNTGLEAAHHDWVALLDSDDEWLPHHLETLWAARGNHAIVGSAARVSGSAGARAGGWSGRRPRVTRRPADAAVPENKFVTSAVMLRRQTALEAGGFSTTMARAEDLDLWMRMLEGSSAVTIPLVTILYHVHSDQVSVDAEKMWAAHQAVLHRGASRWVRRRAEGVLAWDSARAAVAAGAGVVPTALGLTRRLASPQRAIGVTQLLAGRRRARRLAARVAATGEPSVAILPGVKTPAAAVTGAVDLRDRSFPGALLHLSRRPASRALVRGRAGALAVRAVGVEPMPRGRNGRGPDPGARF